jgi:high mobility group protein B2
VGLKKGRLRLSSSSSQVVTKVALADIIEEEHETALELCPAAEEKARERGVEEEQQEEEQQEEEEVEDDEQLETPAKKSKKTVRKKKDPNAPKRPKTAYQLFCSDNRATVRLEHGALSLGGVSAKLAELWKQVTAETKQEYEGRAAPGKAKYKEEKKEYDTRVKKRERRNDDTPQKEKEDGDDFLDKTDRLSRKRMLYASGGEGSIAGGAQ